MIPGIRWRWVAVALLVGSACGGAQAPTAASSGARVTSASSSATAHGRSDLIAMTFREANSSMTIRLMDVTGHVAASTQFTPPPPPTYSNCAPILQPPVRIAGGQVYFADSAGIVRRLSADGSVSQVASFKLTNAQQALSFAVSPDGKQLIAIILSTPPLHNPPPQQLGDPVFAPGTWSLDLETAPAGGQTVEVLHKDLGSTFPSPTVVTGWDAFGPTATLGSAICTQNVVPSLRYTGTLIHLGTDGTHLEQIGGSDCRAWDELTDGTVLCGASDWQSFSVRRRDGAILWSGGGGEMFDVMLSPDGSAVASQNGIIYLRDPVEAASYARTAGPSTMILGWAGPGRVVVLHNDDGHIGLAAQTQPAMFTDFGLTDPTTCPTCGRREVRAIGTVQSA
jgi:hypothetical protein